METAGPGMSMNKTIHRAVRRDLARFRDALDAFRDGDRERAAALHRAWANFDDQLTDHHQGEHAVVWPALAAIGIAGSTIDTFDVEHEAMAADLTTAGQAMARLKSSASRSDAHAAAAAMQRLQVTTVSHLDHEEAVTEEPLRQKEGDPALKEMGKQFSRRSSPAKAGTFFAWMQDGATQEEMSALRTNVPGPVLALLSGLFGRRYRKEVATVWRPLPGAGT
jgi:hemerythrin-like domain-containing protein